MLKMEDGEQNATKSSYIIQYKLPFDQFTVQINAGEKEFCGFVDLEKGAVVTIKYWVGVQYVLFWEKIFRYILVIFTQQYCFIYTY